MVAVDDGAEVEGEGTANGERRRVSELDVTPIDLPTTTPTSCPQDVKNSTT